MYKQIKYFVWFNNPKVAVNSQFNLRFKCVLSVLKFILKLSQMSKNNTDFKRSKN